MAELRTEEEQLEALKRWWKENGMALVAGVVLAAAGLIGWNAWQSYQANQAEAASIRYQQLIGLASQERLDEAGLAEAQRLVDEITDAHDGTLYADLSRLIEARLAVEAGDRVAARAVLGDLVQASEDAYVRDLARLRLARLQLADDEPAAAVATLEGELAEALGAQRAELIGDARLALGEVAAARRAYRDALSLAERHGQALYGVQLKLDDLGQEGADQ
ncbi:YfgM family protein [Bisbaumannia pacifica]|uniref:GTP-binding protein n=1 Tax=Bisbaumannia pacifica TaxID=77098 RepID=A0A510X860_9GAMM|nr:tetratricopeptide repeat protein [Halomonas pacifica]MBH8579117.1 tetratricopeptide repeat protein [Halomonas pacifica]GEK46665.1 GTP-binding protein [Halomonas pacifica]